MCEVQKMSVHLERAAVCVAAIRGSTAGGHLARLTFGLEGSTTN
jgi:hypothetical protein